MKEKCVSCESEELSEDSWFANAIGAFFGCAVLAAVFAPWLIPIATNLFVFFFVEHVEGMIVDMIVGSFLGLLGKRVELGMVGLVISMALQYLIFP